MLSFFLIDAAKVEVIFILCNSLAKKNRLFFGAFS